MSYHKQKSAMGSIPGVDSTMKQGSRGRKGDAGKCGDLRATIGQGKRPSVKAPFGSLRGTIRQ